jgi:hypothetical protein
LISNPQKAILINAAKSPVHRTAARWFEEIHLILVLAAEAASDTNIRLTWEHSEYRWCTAAECEQLVGFRGLQKGLVWVRRYVTETETQLQN